MRICDDLRQAVLQAAIQGKLTKQLPEDGNAADLLKQIAKEKNQLIKEGKIKKEKPLPEVSPDEIPFDIPENWLWVRWGSLAKSIQYGFNAPGLQSGRIKMLRISDISANNTVNWETVPFCNIAEADIDSYLLRPNDILFARTGGTVGKSFLIKELPEPSVYAGYLIRTNYNSILLSPQFLKFFMESLLYWKQLRAGTTKTAQPNCNGQTLSKMMIPLPPLAEQHRIVARIEELLTRIDDLEKTETELEKLKAAFPGDMKAALLQAAMQGKLTEQLPEDGDAADLINQIAKEKGQLIKEGKIKKEKPLPEITSDEVPFDIPENWKWVRFGDISTYGYTTKKINVKDVDGSQWLLDLEDIEKGGRLILKKKVCDSAAKGDRTVFSSGNILYSKLRPYLQKVLIADEDGVCTPELVPFNAFGGINPRYIVFFLLAPHVDKIVNKESYGVKMPRVNTKTMTELCFPLPPLAEQKRIVEKLDKLLPLCDGLAEE